MAITVKAASVFVDPVLDEEIHKRIHPSGLTAYVVRKKTFTRSYATLAARFGSIDTTLDAGGKSIRLPDGFAHFLEHKVFETKEGDAFELFAARGASANAFTSFGSTRYLFGTSTDYVANLRTLIDVVFDLHVTQENVEKEKGIIGQEIAMYADDPGWRLYYGALQALYHRHPVRVDIAGTVDSIQAIDAAQLEAVHHSYYHPRNMVLAAVSPAPVNETFAVLEASLRSRRFGKPPGRRPPPPAEPRAARRGFHRIKMPIVRPRLLVGFKDRQAPRAGRARLRRELASAVLLDCLFGNSGSIFLDLYEAGLVDENFSSSYNAERSVAFAMAGGETDDVARLRRTLTRRLEEARGNGITEEEFERVRNKEVGAYARAFNAPERIAHMLVGHHLRGTTILDYRELLFDLTVRDINRRARALLDPKARTYVVVEPR